MKDSKTISVKAKADDGTVAFVEQNPAHPEGQATVIGNGQTVRVAKTPAVEQAIAEGKLVEVPAESSGVPDDAVSTTTETVETEVMDEEEDDDETQPV